jgi:MIT (microtubule interacting and transport) domain
MENSFVPQAIEIVSKAIEADNAGEYERALALYRDSLARFAMGLKYEKNEARKKLVYERVEGYMKRAEELRDYIAKQNELGPSGQGGSATKKAGDAEEDQDAEKKKLRGALAGAIVSEKPNIRWSDVAGLENAKESLKEVRREYLTFLVLLQMQLNVAFLTHVASSLSDGDFADSVSTTFHRKTSTLQGNFVIWSTWDREILSSQGCGHRSRLYLLFRQFCGSHLQMARRIRKVSSQPFRDGS